MFINCPHCGALVATDPATDQPPPRCPRCAAGLRDDAAGARDGGSAADAMTDAAIAVQTPLPASGVPDTSPPATADGPAMTTPAPARAAAETRAAPAPAATAAPDDPSGVAAGARAPGVLREPIAPDTRPPPDAETRAPVAPAPRLSTPGSPGTPAPSFARARRATARPAPGARRWLLPSAIAVLSLALALQALLADRERLAADPRWRPLVSQACAVLGCSVPAWREPAALSLLDRDVRPHPRQPGVLRVTATFRNDAHWPQAWPGVLLTLSDIDGRVVAARRFEAAEYLGAAPTRAALAPGQSASIRMDVVEPAAGIVSFAFAFD